MPTLLVMDASGLRIDFLVLSGPNMLALKFNLVDDSTPMALSLKHFADNFKVPYQTLCPR